MPYEVRRKKCAKESCTNNFRTDRWITTISEGWFHQTNGKSWCPVHAPAAQEEVKKR